MSSKKYTIKLEAQAYSYRKLLSIFIDILDEINNYENIITEVWQESPTIAKGLVG